MRLFNALNGAEVRTIILREIRAAMESDEQFSKHLAYSLIEWDWTLTVKAHAQEIPEFGQQTDGAIRVSQAEPVVIALRGNRSVTKSEQFPEGEAPDEARAAAGLPVTAVEDTVAGMVEAASSAPSAFDVALARKRTPRSKDGPATDQR